MKPETIKPVIMEFCEICQTVTARQPSDGGCKPCRCAYAEKYREAKRAKKSVAPGPDPRIKRNQQIIDDSKTMSLSELSKKYGMGRNHIGTIITGYARQDRAQHVVPTVYDGVGLYAGRDQAMRAALAALHGAGRICKLETTEPPNEGRK